MASYPPGSCGCVNILIPVGALLGAWVGYSNFGWLGAAAGLLLGPAAAVMLLAAAVTILGPLDRRRSRRNA